MSEWPSVVLGSRWNGIIGGYAHANSRAYTRLSGASLPGSGLVVGKRAATRADPLGRMILQALQDIGEPGPSANGRVPRRLAILECDTVSSRIGRCRLEFESPMNPVCYLSLPGGG
jgi:hypothetical protein